MRPRSDLDVHRSSIEIWLLEEKVLLDDVVHRQLARGCKTSKSTLQRRLRQWGIQLMPRIQNKDEIFRRIDQIYHNLNITDEKKHSMLVRDGYTLSKRSVKLMRQQLGLWKKSNPQDDQELEDTLRRAYEEGYIDNYGKEMLYVRMRREYGLVGRDRIYRAARRINTEAFTRRAKQMKAHRGAVITPGPDYAWSMDAYCKLEHWGIQVYGAIDIHSRCVVWIYIGITGRTGVSVLAGYLKRLVEMNWMPWLVRTDRGGETLMLADAHYQISSELRTREDGQPLEFGDCYRYGTSKMNQRIESWWSRLAKGQANRWRDYFTELSATGQFQKDWLSDRIALLAIYMPIIRYEFTKFVDDWNCHPIRKQPDRPYSVSGRPSELYNYPESPYEHSGTEIPMDPLPESLTRALKHVEGFDMDQYLPPETLDWCTSQLQPAFPLVDGRQYSEDGSRVHEQAYLHLRDACRSHILQGNSTPMLQESDKPYADGWEPSQQLQDCFARAGEGLVEEVQFANF